jgi:hypothetical protein
MGGEYATEQCGEGGSRPVWLAREIHMWKQTMKKKTKKKKKKKRRKRRRGRRRRATSSDDAKTS